MQAVMIKDEYLDIQFSFPYELDRVYSDGYIRLKNSPRIYDGRCFEIFHKGESVSLKRAYRLYQVERLKKKYGMK